MLFSSNNGCEPLTDSTPNPYRDFDADLAAATAEAAAEVSTNTDNFASELWYKLGAKAVLTVRTAVEKYDLGVPIGIGGTLLGGFLLAESGLLDGVTNVLEDPLQQIVDHNILPLQDVEQSEVYQHIFDQQPLPTDMPVQPLTPQDLQ
jgi:hypothetical protein